MLWFVVGYVLPTLLLLSSVLVCWWSERFSNWYIGNEKSVFNIMILFAVTPVINLIYLLLLQVWMPREIVFLCKTGFTKFNIKYPNHLK